MNRIKNLITALLVITLGFTTVILVQKIRNKTISNVEEQIIQIDDSSFPKNPAEVDETTITDLDSFAEYEEKLPNVPVLNIKYAYSFDAALENEILRLLNEYRKENGLNELQMDGTLQKIARWKSNSQIQNNYFGYNDVNYGYTPDIVENKMDGITETYTKLGENLHYTTRVSVSAINIIEAWKNSSVQNKNMLEPGWTHVGLGIARTNLSGSMLHGQEATLSTQVFGCK